MLYLTVFLLFLLIFIVLFGILSVINRDKIEIEKRVKQLNNSTAEDDKSKDKPFLDRMLMPFYKSISESVLRLTPKHKLEQLNKKLDKAGLSKNSSTGKWLFKKTVTMLIFSTSLGLLAYMASKNAAKSLLIALLIMLTINYAFNFYLSVCYENRKKKILKDLPYTLDLITVSVEAGLSFDGAISRVINSVEGELCDEFAKCLKESRMGIDRKKALKNMDERCNVKALSTLITSINQADELGVSLSRVLRIEAANLREHRKQASKEKAMKAPIKMLFPLVFFIFPSIFIIILGPAVINIIRIFGGK